MGLPLKHRIDSRAIFVLPDDSAWDNDAIEAGEAERDPSDEIPDDVPEGETIDDIRRRIYDGCSDYQRYIAGYTRYDIDPVRHLLKEGVDPTEFHLRRLTMTEREDIQGELDAGRWRPGYLKAFSLGCVDIRGDSAVVDALRAERVRLPKGNGRTWSSAELERLDDLLGTFTGWVGDGVHEATVAVHVGAAVVKLSQPMFPWEGKR